MAGGWPHPDSTARTVLLLTGTVSGFVGAILLLEDSLVLLAVAALGIALFALAHASAVHHVSPRLALEGAAALGIGAALPAIGRLTGLHVLGPVGVGLAWLGVGMLAATQWFDLRRTFGMAGLGLAASALGILGYFSDLVLGYSDDWVAVASDWPGGTTLWQWILIPWYLAYVLTLIWFAGTAAWLAVAHLKEHAARARPKLAQEP